MIIISNAYEQSGGSELRVIKIILVFRNVPELFDFTLLITCNESSYYILRVQKSLSGNFFPVVFCGILNLNI